MYPRPCGLFSCELRYTRCIRCASCIRVYLPWHYLQSVPLDCFFANIRSRECNSSNLLADLCRETTKSDITILNSGTLRADRMIPAGDFCIRDLLALLPLDDPIVLIGEHVAVRGSCTRPHIYVRMYAVPVRPHLCPYLFPDSSPYPCPWLLVSPSLYLSHFTFMSQ